MSNAINDDGYSVGYEELSHFVSSLFMAAGSNEQESRLIGDGLVESNLVGHDSHGVLRVPIYLADIAKGVVRCNASPKQLSSFGAFTAYDGMCGMGHAAGEVVVEEGIRLAREFGVGIVTLCNSGHLGRIGRWSEKAAAEGVLSLHCVNTSGGAPAGVLLAAAFGGRDRRMSINPVSIGLPRPDQAPIILDATMAATAGGKVMAARNRGDLVPEGQIIDKEGQPSRNPDDLFEGGAILPFGDHRGYGLSFMIDVMAGALSGGGCSGQTRYPHMNNMFSLFVSPTANNAATMASDLEEFSNWVCASEPIDRDRPVLLPGDIERQTAKKRRESGIPLDSRTFSDLNALGEKYNVPLLAS
ncbi:Ldh family oxidoreductase [Oricola indica]|uniref:Ldh family oxidoreductase n=1 Tax=Oricola indica TaxID=2872591 RepID=UPI001CC1242D|nr:Ldh family oxidoreductase [Oricola indica]